MLIVWGKSLNLEDHFASPHLSSSNRDEDDSDKEVPDEKEEGEEELAGPEDLADGHIHLHQLARIDVGFWEIIMVNEWNLESISSYHYTEALVLDCRLGSQW